MRVMFAVFVLSLAALFVTLLALRHRIRKHHAHPGELALSPETQH
ncbi:MAG TPA: hypothetical protein VFW25_04945 [Silvibacterium sp.]|nr:hypothetical protein [Silvibacterium sp.]